MIGTALKIGAVFALSLSFSGGGGVREAAAGDLVYSPKIPAFGGSPLLDDYFISTAQIQNQFVESGGGGGGSSAPPVINFPPITIDLGGVADGAGDEEGASPE